VRLSFPVTFATTAENRPVTGSKLEAASLRILVVDDDPLILKSLTDTLELDGHFVTTADTGEIGIDAFRSAQVSGDSFAIVITDMGMPHMDGRRVASIVKGMSPSTPVILLTGWGQQLANDGTVLPHVDRVLSKPPRLRELREALAHCCPSGAQGHW
jgi:CheY-like chemotaxis protein